MNTSSIFHKVVRWHISGEVDKFTTFWYTVSSGLRIPKIIEIGPRLTEFSLNFVSKLSHWNLDIHGHRSELPWFCIIQVIAKHGTAYPSSWNHYSLFINHYLTQISLIYALRHFDPVVIDSHDVTQHIIIHYMSGATPTCTQSVPLCRRHSR